MNVAIIGAGPSGFYAAQALLDAPVDIQVDLYDRLPTPFGLVRGGVAPDHPKIKAISEVYERLLQRPRLRFRGNVRIGVDLSPDDLDRAYDAVVWAVGCESGRVLDLPGADLEGVHSATEFVYWYNAHPDHAGREFGLERTRRAVVVGNGNVALDVARMLVRRRAELEGTDIARYALAALRGSPLEEVCVLGRRGPDQAAYTSDQLAALTRLDGVRTWSRDPTVELPGGRGPERRHIELRYLASPVEFVGRAGVLTGVRCVRNELVREGDRLVARATDETWIEPCELVFQAIGHRGLPIEGVPQARGIIPSAEGRVEGHPSWYVVGWAKRGPSGRVGTNRGDARSTVASLLADLPGLARAPGSPDDLELGVDVVDASGWARLDAEERRRGDLAGCPRLKFSRVDQMLAFLAS
ncbi:MAG: FAD-dependent oxidoreductase [Proteobacteria bacterium]|nr:FAD-dependent oxidoreductase [Pseudomonadota bacterium]MCP4922155.1 FAD-dependent oxidoreductase [Pseudomonadota bacterium]